VCVEFTSQKMGSIHEWKKSRDSEKIKEKDDKWVE